jgi:hypothetical protein
MQTTAGVSSTSLVKKSRKTNERHRILATVQVPLNTVRNISEFDKVLLNNIPTYHPFA